MIYRVEVEIEVPEAQKCPVHEDTLQKKVGAAARKAIKEIHQSGARLLNVDSWMFEG